MDLFEKGRFRAAADIYYRIVLSDEALGACINVRILEFCPQVGLREDRSECGEKMALSDAALTCQCVSVPAAGRHNDDTVEPFGHQVGRYVSEIIAA